MLMAGLCRQKKPATQPVMQPVQGLSLGLVGPMQQGTMVVKAAAWEKEDKRWKDEAVLNAARAVVGATVAEMLVRSGVMNCAEFHVELQRGVRRILRESVLGH